MKLYQYDDTDFAVMPDDLAGVLAYWTDLAAGRLGPSWAEFDLMTGMPPKLIPFSNVADVVRGGEDFYFRFYGTNLAEILGKELSGKWVSDGDPKELANAAMTSMRQVVQRRAPVFQNAIIHSRYVINLQRLIRLPLSDDGTEVTHILTVAHFERGIRDSKQIVAETLTGRSRD